MNHENQNGMTKKGILENPLVGKLAAAFLLVATVFMFAKAVNAIVNFDTIAQPPSNVITVNGEGKVSAVPDIATISFTVSEDADTATHAQDGATKKVNVALALLKDLEMQKRILKPAHTMFHRVTRTSHRATPTRARTQASKR